MVLIYLIWNCSNMTGKNSQHIAIWYKWRMKKLGGLSDPPDPVNRQIEHGDRLPSKVLWFFFFFSPVDTRNERITSIMNLVVLQDALRVKNITWVYLRSSFSSLATPRTSGLQSDQYKGCSRKQIAELDIKMWLQLSLISSSAHI